MEKFDINKTRAIAGKEIVAEIHRQVMTMTPVPVRWSWGADGWTDWDHKALRFRVRGHHHNGYIYIVLNGSDLYDIYLVSLKGNVKKEFTDIFGEDMPELIDNAIERIAAYA